MRHGLLGRRDLTGVAGCGELVQQRAELGAGGDAEPAVAVAVAPPAGDPVAPLPEPPGLVPEFDTVAPVAAVLSGALKPTTSGAASARDASASPTRVMIERSLRIGSVREPLDVDLPLREAEAPERSLGPVHHVDRATEVDVAIGDVGDGGSERPRRERILGHVD